MTRLKHHPAAPIVLILILFLVLTIVMTWPLPRYAGSSVQDLLDPLYDIWAMRWVQHQLLADPLNLWNANVGYPFTRTLLFSEPRITNAILTWPVYALTGNEVLAYNALFLLSFVVVGVGTALLVREITGSLPAGIATGIMAAFAPYRYGHLSHMNLLNHGWMLFAILFFVRYARTRRPVDAALGSLSLLLQFYASDTLALLSLIALTPFAVVAFWTYRTFEKPRCLLIAFGSVLVPIVLFLPVVLGRLEMGRVYGFSRTLDDIRDHVATPSHFVSVHGDNYLLGDVLPNAYPNPLFPGIIACLLGFAGVVLGWRIAARWICAALMLFMFGSVMAMGPDLEIGSTTIPLPFRAFYAFVPGFDSMRDTARFGLLMLMGVHVLAGIGLTRVLSIVNQCAATASMRYVKNCALVLLCLFLLAEYRTEVLAEPVDRSAERLAVYHWLAVQPPGAVMEFPADGHWTALGRTIEPIYYSIYHWQPLVHTYTSFIPHDHFRLIDALHDGWNLPSYPSEHNIGMLQDLGVRYVLVHHHEDLHGYDPQEAVSSALGVKYLDFAGQFGSTSAFVVHEVSREPVTVGLVAPSRLIAGEKVQISTVAWNSNPNPALLNAHPYGNLEIIWRDSSGEVLKSGRHRLDSFLIVRDGVQMIPVYDDAPEQPGTYQLELTFEFDHVHQSVLNVQVFDQRRPAGDGDLVLHAVHDLDVRYRAGEWLYVTAEFTPAIGPADALVITVQLIDDDGLVTQWDGRLTELGYIAADHPANQAFIAPLALHLPDGLDSGEYQVLVALYNADEDGLPRFMLELPDGSLGTEFLETIEVER